MDRLRLTKVKSFTKVKSLSILTLIQRDDGQKEQTLEAPANGASV